jgi:hypothetical protein
MMLVLDQPTSLRMPIKFNTLLSKLPLLDLLRRISSRQLDREVRRWKTQLQVEDRRYPNLL